MAAISQKRNPRITETKTLRREFFVCAAVLFCVTLIAYVPAIRGGFIFDDDTYLTNNALIQSPHGLYEFWFTTKAVDYYPVSNTSLWLEWRLWVMNASGYHCTNVLLHVITSLLLWVVLRALLVPGAFLAAMLFAVHPVNVESVAWISQRKDLLSLLFVLLSVLCFLKTEPPPQSKHPVTTPPTTVWWWLSLIAFTLAMLSKGSAASLPLMLLLILWWRRGRITMRDIAPIAPFFAITLVLTVALMWFWRDAAPVLGRGAGPLERLTGAGAVVWFYLYKAVWPVDLQFVYPEWHIQPAGFLWWLPLLGVVLVSATLWRFRKTWGRTVLFAWLFLLIALLPVMGFVDSYFMNYSLVADHYQHTAIAAPIAMAAAGWSLWRRKQRFPAIGAAIALVATLALMTHQQTQIYRDAKTLYQDTIKKNPRCWLAYCNLGNVLFESDPAAAIESYTTALRLNPQLAEAHQSLGSALYQQGRFEEAILHWNKTIDLKPNVPEPYNCLAQLYATASDPRFRDGAKAVHFAERAVELTGGNDATTLALLGDAYAEAGQLPDAIAVAEKALNLALANSETDLAQRIQVHLAQYRARQANPATTNP